MFTWSLLVAAVLGTVRVTLLVAVLGAFLAVGDIQVGLIAMLGLVVLAVGHVEIGLNAMFIFRDGTRKSDSKEQRKEDERDLERHHCVLVETWEPRPEEQDLRSGSSVSEAEFFDALCAIPSSMRLDVRGAQYLYKSGKHFIDSYVCQKLLNHNWKPSVLTLRVGYHL